MDGDRHLTGRAMARHLGEWRTAEAGVAYLELAERIKLLVLDGRLPLHTRLPAERELAVALRLSRTTVAAGYDRLRESGYLHSRRGAGSWTTMPEGPTRRELTAFAPAAESTALDLAYAALPAPPEQLTSALRAAGERVARYTGGSGYQLLGLDVLRDAVAARFTDRGLPTTRDQVLITCGGQQAIALVLDTLTSPGDRVLVEHPTYPNALDAIARMHARAVPVGFPSARAEGWDVDTMGAAVRDAAPRLILLIPDYHNPTGRCMDDNQRAEVATLGRRTHTPLLIDETVTELVLDGPAPTPFAALAADSGSAPVITVGSASKTFWGGIRIGWVRASRPMIERIARTKASVDIASSVLDQLVVEHLLGEVEPVLARRLPMVRAAREHLRSLVAGRFPGWTATHPPGGLSLWVDLGAPVSSMLVTAAARHGVLLAAGPRFGLDGAFERFLRLPYTLPEPRLDLAVERLAAAWLSLSTVPGWTGAPTEVA
ncbi:MAG: PLP-dependent aminotransferase family protein [Actinomycetota bacterium]|nr:PLP-dependent aminotransferase family protein [Actinomycetota bacterium]